MTNYLNWFYYLFLLLSDEPDYVDIDFRIIGGEPVKIEEVPFFAIYKPKEEKYGCGATIVSERFLVSAKHCYNPHKNNMEIVVGTDKIHEGEHYEILESYPHPGYDNNIIDCDVIVIKLVKELVFSSKVQPIKLAEPDMEVEDDAVFKVIGFGVTESGSSSPKLLQVKVPHVKYEDCKKIYYYLLTHRMICAGALGKGACNGDSGGPLIYQNRHIGIVSFGPEDCSQKGKPTVFAKVSALRDFIDEQMAK